MKIFKIKIKQKLEEWPDKELKNWLNKEQSTIKFWKEWLTDDTWRQVFSQILKIKNKQKLEECTDKPLKNWLNPMKFKNKWLASCI